MTLRKFPKVVEPASRAGSFPILCVYFSLCQATFFCSFVLLLHGCISVNYLYFFLFKFRDLWYLILSYTPGEQNDTPNRRAATAKS